MPEMDGFTAARDSSQRSIRRDTSAAQYCGPDGECMEGDRQRCLEAGMDDYLAKPLQPGKLHELLQKYAHTNEDESPEF